MVLTDTPTRMSRTDEVHRITENVYKVRPELRLFLCRRAGVLLPRRDTCCTGGTEGVRGHNFDGFIMKDHWETYGLMLGYRNS